MTTPLRRFSFFFVCLVCAAFSLGTARAHEPFEGNVRMIVTENELQVIVTFGSGAARQILSAGGLDAREVERLTVFTGESNPLETKAALAPLLVELSVGKNPLHATRFDVIPEEDDIIFTAHYPRPTSELVLAKVTYFDHIGSMRSGSFVATDRRDLHYADALVSRSNPFVEVPLPSQTSATSSTQRGNLSTAKQPSRPSFAEFLELGIEHILTGFDHLLFLSALLLGVKRLKSMFAIITAFTLAHSITLALAALEIVAISSRIVEPLIAASIIVVGLENLLRKDSPTDRYWLAGTFGLIHGFGFASALRDTGLGHSGAALAVPLLSFNLGVETGQLLVAAVVVPLIFLARRKLFFTRYVAPALSILIIAISTYWLLQRTLLG